MEGCELRRLVGLTGLEGKNLVVAPGGTLEGVDGVSGGPKGAITVFERTDGVRKRLGFGAGPDTEMEVRSNTRQFRLRFICISMHQYIDAGRTQHTN